MAIERATTTMVLVWRFMVSSLLVVYFLAGRIAGATNVAPTRCQHGRRRGW